MVLSPTEVLRKFKEEHPVSASAIEADPCPECKVAPGEECRNPVHASTWYHAGRLTSSDVFVGPPYTDSNIKVEWKFRDAAEVARRRVRSLNPRLRTDAEYRQYAEFAVRKGYGLGLWFRDWDSLTTGEKEKWSQLMRDLIREVFRD